MIQCCRRPATEVKRKVRTPPSFGQFSGRAIAYTCWAACVQCGFRILRFHRRSLETGRNVLQHAQQAAAARDIAVEGESANITIAGKLPWSPPTLTEIAVRQLAGRDGLGDADLEHYVHNV